MGVVIGVYATPTISQARAQLVRRLRELQAVAPWLNEDPNRPRRGATLTYQMVLVAYDGSPASDRAVEAAVEFARQGAHVVGVTVRPPTGDAGGEASTELVEMIVAHAGSFGVRLSTELRTGHPAQEILAAARTHRADLIVLGRSGRPAAWGRFLGHDGGDGKPRRRVFGADRPMTNPCH